MTRKRFTNRAVRWPFLVAAGLLGVITLAPQAAVADQGGSFWIPGFWGSLAATPQQPGWSVTTFYYHTTVSAPGTDAESDTAHVIPWYVFETPFLGGQAAIGAHVTVGHASASMDAPAAGMSSRLSDSAAGFGDPALFLVTRWNAGANNFMTYVTGNIPVGSYDPNRLSNLGLGHGAIDAGGGYTYFDQQTGYEFSTALGFTYNFLNQSTQVRNGVDMHIDWGASKFINKQLQLGVVGYLYQQVSCDSGSGNEAGCFKSRVAGIGPQIGYSFPLGDLQGYVNLKGYKEFDAANRPEGWNVWLTFAIPLGNPR